MGELFKKLINGEFFRFGNDNKINVKSDDSHYFSTGGRRSINPLTLVFPVLQEFKKSWEGREDSEGDSDVRPDDNG